MTNYYNKYYTTFADEDGNSFQVNLKKRIELNVQYEWNNQNFQTNTDWYNYLPFGGTNWVITNNSAQVILTGGGSSAFFKQDFPFRNQSLQAITVYIDYSVSGVTSGSGDTRIISNYWSGDTIITSRVFTDSVGEGSFFSDVTFNLPVGVDAISFQAVPLSGSSHTVIITQFNSTSISVPQGITGDSSSINVGSLSPVNITYTGGREDKDSSPIKQSNAIFEFFKFDEDDYTDLFESNYRDFLIEIKKNGNPYWYGWVQPDQLTARWLSEKYLVSIKANDGLLDLNEILFPSTEINTNYEKVIKHLKSCLNQTGLQLDIDVQVNLKEYNFPNSNSVENALVTNRRFRTLKDGRSTSLATSVSLEYLLKWMNAIVFQADGHWRIQQRNEISSILYSYNFNNLSFEVTTGYTRLVSINQTNASPLFQADELSKQKPIKYIDLTHRNIYEGDPLINLTFESTSGVTNGGYTASWHTFDIVGNRLRTAVANTSPTTMGATSFITQPFFVEKLSTGDTINGSIENMVQAYINFAATGSTMPTIELRLSGATSGIFYTYTGTSEYFAFKKFEFKASIPSTQNMRLIVNVVPVTPVEDIQMFWDNLSVSVNYDNAAVFDQYYLITNTGNTTFIDNYETEIHFGDADFVNQKQTGVIKYNSTGLTYQWSNFGSNENAKIAVLTGFNRLRLKSKFTDYIRCSFINNTIKYFNILEIKNKKYEIIGLRYDLKNKLMDLELSEHPENEILASWEQFALRTIDGLSTSLIGGGLQPNNPVNVPPEPVDNIYNIEVYDCALCSLDGYGTVSNAVSLSIGSYYRLTTDQIGKVISSGIGSATYSLANYTPYATCAEMGCTPPPPNVYDIEIYACGSCSLIDVGQVDNSVPLITGKYYYLSSGNIALIQNQTVGFATDTILDYTAYNDCIGLACP